MLISASGIIFAPRMYLSVLSLLSFILFSSLICKSKAFRFDGKPAARKKPFFDKSDGDCGTFLLIYARNVPFRDPPGTGTAPPTNDKGGHPSRRPPLSVFSDCRFT